MKLFMFILFPLLLFANLNFAPDYKQELGVLASLDIEASFLYDRSMEDIRIKRSSSSENRYFFNALENASLFLPTIKKIIDQQNLPKEFVFLPMVESSYKMKTFSNKSASGIWQFTPSTAKLYGLKIDRFVDERLDIIQSTKAATSYLKKLYKRFGKWYLAALAYNCGPTRLAKGIQKAKSDELSVLLDKNHSYIPKETKRYIRKIVAFCLIGSDEELLLHNNQSHFLNIATKHSLCVVKLTSGESLKRVATLLNIDYKMLQSLNRHLKHNFIPPYLKEYSVYIPYEKVSDFRKKYIDRLPQKRFKIHKVQHGENLKFISAKYGVYYRDIMKLNHLISPKIKTNQKLFIPLV